MAQTTTSPELRGLLARFDTPGALIAACREVREAGYQRFDAHCPFPVHGLQTAMGLKPSRVPWFVFLLSMAGAAAGMLLQWWVHTQAYPLVISGKPYFSWPAFVPIMFETGILGGAVGAIVGFLALARLPRPHHVLFNSEAFERVTDDAFFLSIEAEDPRFEAQGTEALLRQAGAVAVEPITA